MGVYAKIENGKIIKVVPKPKWKLSDGSLVDDSVLIPQGYVPVDYESRKPEIDEFYQQVKVKPCFEWAIINGNFNGIVFEENNWINKELENIPIKVEVEYEVITKDISEIKQQLKQKIKQEFLNSFNRGYECSLGFKVDCKKEDLLNFKGALEYCELLEKDEIKIRDYNNEFHLISVDNLKKLISELLEYHQSLFNKKWQKEEELESLNTIEDLKNFQIWE